ncbi:MAG: FAD-dependent oxidoreductase [Proteobacteria bacterium]|nr:FAD-dependent oxidoreductase [Pseudomonadota bacterium]
MNVAIIGSGIAGLAAARALAGRHDLVIFEAADRPGGHVHTVVADGHAIDMGFIVCNRQRYPHFMRMLGELGVTTRPTQMAFSVSHDGLEWSSASLGAMFAQRGRLADPRHWRFLAVVLAFLRRARRDLALADPTLRAASLDDYLAARHAPSDLRERFVVPLAAALWSLAPDRCGEFPAETFLRFLDQHGMLRPVGPLAWETVVGGSRRYVDALVAELVGTGRVTLRLATPARRIDRHATGVLVDGAPFDRVIVATHADTALQLLATPSAGEREVLGAFRYSTNRTVLHTDRSFLPRAPRAHASWNYVADPDTSRVDVTYSMTRLQGLPDAPYLVTLNPRREPASPLAEATFQHPQFDRAALAAQARLPGLGAAHRTYYCGAHFGFGFHEDGMRAGLAAAASVLADEHRPGRAP